MSRPDAIGVTFCPDYARGRALSLAVACALYLMTYLLSKKYETFQTFSAMFFMHYVQKSQT